MSQNHWISGLLLKCKPTFLHLYCSGTQRVPINPQHGRVILTLEALQYWQHFCLKAKSRRKSAACVQSCKQALGRGIHSCLVFLGFLPTLTHIEMLPHRRARMTPPPWRHAQQLDVLLLSPLLPTAERCTLTVRITSHIQESLTPSLGTWTRQKGSKIDLN